jgi:hypothetical protein
VKKSLRLLCILSVLPLCSVAHASVKVVSVGVKTPTECPALQPLVADLKDVQFPDGWTVYVTCTARAWDDAGRQLDTRGRTNAAMTSQTGYFTVINGAVYSSSFDWTGTRQRTGKEVLRHERGHILCRCNDEDKADKAAGL